MMARCHSHRTGHGAEGTGLRHRAMGTFLAVLLVLQPMWLLAQSNEPVLPNPGTVGMSKEQQEQLGQKAMAEVYQQMPILPDSDPVVKYVQQLGAKLDHVIPAQYNWPYQFHVVQESDINAFALPGGPIFINVGTITAAANEAQLAGVISHEMSHVYLQHSAKLASQQTPGILAGLGQVLGKVIGGVGGTIAQIGGQLGGGLLSMKYSRGDESQADHNGAIIMYLSNYNPIEMAKFFQTLEQQGGSRSAQLLSDHPNPGNRVAAVDNEIKNWPPKNYVDDTPQFQQAKQQAMHVKTYTAQQIAEMAKSGQIHNTGVPSSVSDTGATGGGASLGNVTYQQIAPSGQFQQFSQNGISIQYPSNWQVAGTQQQSGTTIAPAAGVNKGSVGYGVVINGGQLQNATSLDSATQQLIQSLEQQNPGLKATGSPQTITVNGVDARSVHMQGTSPVQENGKPLTEEDWLVDMAGPNNTIVFLVFIAPQRDFSRLQPTYEQMLKTFHLQ